MEIVGTKVTDARGREVRSLYAPGAEVPSDAAKALGRERFLRVCGRVGALVSTDSRGSMIALGVIVGVVGVLLIVGALAFRGVDTFVLLFYGVPATLGSVGIIVGVSRFRPRMPNVDATLLASAVAAEGVCPSCAYGLENLMPEADGGVVCPECGAAWIVGVTTPPLPGAEAGEVHRTPGGA
ncbi:MAG: hypothetical protein HBSAPP03_01830 [Phycisphaerae bacterium]|nr:MAG: hypothetical protein HBSAPP03_01830 [Phycisphaerae bacterium]